MPTVTCPTCLTPATLPDPWPHPGFTCSRCGATVALTPAPAPAPPAPFDLPEPEERPLRHRSRERSRNRSSRGGVFKTMFVGGLGCLAAVVLVCGLGGFLLFKGRNVPAPQQNEVASGKDGKRPTGKGTEGAGRNKETATAQEPTAKSRWIALGSPSLNFPALKAGDLGVMPIGEYTVFGEKKTHPTEWKVLQILDAENALMTHIDGFYKETNGETFWFEMGTSNLVDSRSYIFDGIWECKGTRRYTTAIRGTRTVFVLHYCGKQ